MGIALAGNQALLSWPIPSSNLALQQTSDLRLGDWSDVNGAPVLNLTNLNFQVLVPVPSIGATFFRLKD
jgi:hypothetical protein